MTYIKRLAHNQHDFDHPLCGDCLAKRPGWHLIGGPDTTYGGAFDRPWHAHQPEPWCAAQAGYWGLPKGTCCSDCGCDLHDHDERNWGKATPGRVRLLAERGLLYRLEHHAGASAHLTRVSLEDLGDHPELADMPYAELATPPSIIS